MQLESIITNFLSRSDAARENTKARSRCKTLANRLGIEITVERDSLGWCYWICSTQLEGERFCTSWLEVEDKLKRIKEDRG
jgi:hypothetical protein